MLVAYAYDARGNLTAYGTSSYTFNADNLLTGGPGGAMMDYDALGRIAKTSPNPSTAATRYLWDGITLAGEYSSGVMTRRYVHGPGSDEPIIWYEGTGTADRRFLMRDERGSIVSVANSSGTIIAINSYDEYGNPASTNQGRFGYSGGDEENVWETFCPRHADVVAGHCDVLLPRPHLRAQPGPVPADRPHRLRRWHEPLCVRRQ